MPTLNYKGWRVREVDRDAGVIYGFTVAETGELSGHDGRFDRKSLESIRDSINASAKGVKSHYTHPTLSNDGLSHILGRARNASIESFEDQGGNTVDAVLADLHFNETAFKEPVGGGRPMAEHIMELTETDPGLFASSIQVGSYSEGWDLDDKGEEIRTDQQGRYLKPYWHDVEVKASDIVSDGAAVTAFMSDEGRMLDDDYIRHADQMISAIFKGQNLSDVRSKLHAWVDRFVEWKKDPGLAVQQAKVKLREKELALKKKL